MGLKLTSLAESAGVLFSSSLAMGVLVVRVRRVRVVRRVGRCILSDGSFFVDWGLIWCFAGIGQTGKA